MGSASPGNRLQTGTAVLAAARGVDTRLIGARLKGFERAHKLYVDIETRVRQWARRSGHDRTTNVWPHPEAVLRTWYATAYTRTEQELAPYEATIAGWIEAIHDLLDPPHRYDINAPCPQCHTTWTVVTIDGHEAHVQALNATDYDPPQQHRSSVSCRACGAL